MKRNEDRRERSEKSDVKVRVRTGMKAGFDWSTPASVGSLTELTELDLSKNTLTAEIPKVKAGFAI